MGFTNFPLVDGIIEQVNLLEKQFENQLEPHLAYSRVADRFPIAAKGGETLTLSRPSLLALGAQGALVNPANNSGLDNGLTVSTYGFEQIQIAVQEYANTMDVSLEQQEVLIAKLLLQNMSNQGQNAAATIDQLVAITAHKAYDAGNTFATAAAISGATSVAVDNIYGFDTAYSTVANSSPGLPAAVSASNTLSATVYNGSTGASKGTITITGVAAAGTNASTAYVNGNAYGASGTLTVSATTFAISAGDQIVATDGAYVLRPNAKTSRYQLATSDTLTLQLVAQAAAKLKARAVRPMSNGLYAAIIDPLILPQLLGDVAFQRATTMGLESMRYFKRGIPLPMYGIELVESNMVPAFSLPAAGSASGAGMARHAIVVGDGAFVKSPFEGSLIGASTANGMRGPSQVRRMAEDILMILRAPLDRFADRVSTTWKWTGGFAAMTDVTSTPSTIPTTDSARYKRAVAVEVYNSF